MSMKLLRKIAKLVVVRQTYRGQPGFCWLVAWLDTLLATASDRFSTAFAQMVLELISTIHN